MNRLLTLSARAHAALHRARPWTIVLSIAATLLLAACTSGGSSSGGKY